MLAQMGQQAPESSSQRSEFTLPGSSAAVGAVSLTGGRDGIAAWSGHGRTGDQTAGGVMDHLGHDADCTTRPLVVHGHAVREGVARRVVGLTVVAANFLLLPAGLLTTQDTLC